MLSYKKFVTKVCNDTNEVEEKHARCKISKSLSCEGSFIVISVPPFFTHPSAKEFPPQGLHWSLPESPT